MYTYALLCDMPAIGNSGNAEATAGRHGARQALQRAFGDVLAERGQIAAALPVQIPSPQPMAPSTSATTSSYTHSSVGQQGQGPITLASAFLARGRADSVPLTEFLDCVANAQKSLRFPHWNQNACKVSQNACIDIRCSFVCLFILFVQHAFLKIGMCGTPSPGEHMSVLAVYNRYYISCGCFIILIVLTFSTLDSPNSTSFGSVLSREMKGFQRLYRYCTACTLYILSLCTYGTSHA